MAESSKLKAESRGQRIEFGSGNSEVGKSLCLTQRRKATIWPLFFVAFFAALREANRNCVRFVKR